jgi:hypothetical protein
LNRIKIIGIVTLIGLVGYFVYHNQTRSNPFDGVEWIEDWPGTTERYVTFTPVLKSNKKPIGPTVGADYAVLTFEDLDHDGIKEAIIETSKSIHLEFFHAERHVLKFKPDSISGGRFEYIDGPSLGSEKY